MHYRHTLWSQTIHNPTTKCKVNSILWSQTIHNPTTTCNVHSISTWPNDAWQAIDLRLSKTSMLPRVGEGTWVSIFFFFKLVRREFIMLAFNTVWGVNSGANLKECHCKKMSSIGEMTDSIHADWRSYQ